MEIALLILIAHLQNGGAFLTVKSITAAYFVEKILILILKVIGVHLHAHQSFMMKWPLNILFFIDRHKNDLFTILIIYRRYNKMFTYI